MPMPPRNATAKYLTPLVIGVTGHRDLVPSEIEELEHRVEQLIAGLEQRFPNTPIRLMSALAEGADRLAARVALRRGLEVQAVLPMPAKLYRDDFHTAETKAEFDELCSKSELVELIPSENGTSCKEFTGPNRDLAYAQAGIFISAHCHILLALWDGKQSERVGGTAQIIYFQHYDRLPGIAESVPRTSLFLTDDESDLVYHIPCSRVCSENDNTKVEPSGPTWFTTYPDAPNLKDLPERYVRVFSRTDEFNADAGWYLSKQYLPLDTELPMPEIQNQESAQPVSRMFGIADALADHFQKRVNFTLRSTHALAVLTGLAFILYSEVSNMNALIFIFLAFLLTGIVIAAAAQRRDWHRKYLDYRVLAEGLRVQFFWAIAGIRGEGQTKFAYDNFLRQRDMELGWIRNVMRVAGTPSDSRRDSYNVSGLKFAIDNWIGGNGKRGQLDYYRSKAILRGRVNRYTEWLASASLWVGILIACVLAFFLNAVGDSAREPLIVLMGVLPLFAAVADAYTQRKASRELTKQYEFMEHVFSNARRRLDQSSGDNECREVLQGLGDAALTEHAEWILIHRDRKPDTSGI